MKKYYYSFAAHIIALLLLLSFGRWDIQQDKPFEQVIIVDFSEQSDRKTQHTAPKPKTTKKSAPKQKTVVKPQKAKTTPTSQKPKEQSKSTEAATEAKIKAQLAQEKAAQQAAQKLAEEQRQEKIEKEKEKSEKVDYFKTLFKNSVAQSEQRKDSEKTVAKESQEAETDFSKDKSLSGEISSRKVLKKPIIRDNTQKEGRVIVKICVDASGKVISSSYTQIGSTTTDSHLIELAEKGAMQYQFSTSEVSRQCGRVIIDFTLRA